MSLVVAKSFIIIASGRSRYATSGSLDELIRAVLALKKTPIVVLGPDGDDLLRNCTELESCEIVFDPNFEGALFSSIKAGLEAVNGPAFVLPLAELAVDASQWPDLERVLLETERGTHVVRPVTQNSEDVLYPQIVTAQGLLPLKALPASTDWLASERIIVQKYPLNPRLRA